jgi:hypothetical protein
VFICIFAVKELKDYIVDLGHAEKFLMFQKCHVKVALVIYFCNLSPQEADAGELELETTLGCIGRYCLKNEQINNSNKSLLCCTKEKEVFVGWQFSCSSKSKISSTYKSMHIYTESRIADFGYPFFWQY